MKYYSEKLDKLFDTVEALEDEELKLKIKEEEQRAAAARKESDVEELEDEFEYVCDILSDYLQLAAEFVAKYGYLPSSVCDEKMFKSLGNLGSIGGITFSF